METSGGFASSTPNKRRPVLVLGRDELLPSWSLVPVVPLSTQVRGLSWEVHLGPGDGLPTACVLKPEWIRAVERTGLGPRISTLADHRWDEVQRADLQVLGFVDF